MVGKLVKVDWVGLPYDAFDSIQSLLVEHQDWYYLAPNNQFLCYLTREFGLVMLTHDFTDMDEEAITEYIMGAMELLYGE